MSYCLCEQFNVTIAETTSHTSGSWNDAAAHVFTGVIWGGHKEMIVSVSCELKNMVV